MQAPVVIDSPVYSLQSMLRTIAFRYPNIPRLIPDGIFGEQTLEAVMVFQRDFFPPVTGVVDNATWDAIAIIYQQAMDQLSPPLPAAGFPSWDYTISPGEDSVHFYLVQAMFRALSHILENIEDCAVTGRCTQETLNNIRLLQRVADLPVTGVLDKAVWDVLSRMYTIFVANAQSPQFSRAEALSRPR